MHITQKKNSSLDLHYFSDKMRILLSSSEFIIKIFPLNEFRHFIIILYLFFGFQRNYIH